MGGLAVLLVLAAAVLHACWNAILRSTRDRVQAMAVLGFTAGLAGLIAIPFLPAPARPSWPFILASGCLHILYDFLLAWAYRSADLGQSYPIARGSAPLLASLGAAVFAGQVLPPRAIGGVALIGLGVIAMGLRDPRRLRGSGLGAALATGACIATYTITDGIGVRLAGGAPAYAAWEFAFEILVLPIFLAGRGRRGLRAPWRELARPAFAGVMAVITYTMVLAAFRLGALGIVAALRETSVVFATLIGWLFLGERLTPRRLAAALVIAAGAMVLAIG